MKKPGFNIFYPGERGWKRLALASLAVGIGGTAAACLANYNWHLFRDGFLRSAPVLDDRHSGRPGCYGGGLPDGGADNR